MLKKVVQRTLNQFGLEVIRSRNSASPFIPFKKDYKLQYKGGLEPCRFDFWLANESANLWYNEWFFTADRPTWELDEFSWLVQPGDRVLEIGCHHGFLMMMIAHRVGADGFVLGLDANPENVLITQAQIALNGLNDICKAFHMAASSEPGKLDFAWRTNSHVLTEAHLNHQNSYTVEAITGDALDAIYGPFNVLKIDVEGFEVDVLKGCKTLLSKKPKLILELHPQFMSDYGYGHTLSDVFSLIDIADYEGTMVVRPNFGRSLTFSPDQVPLDQVSNLHLQPKLSRL